MSNPPRTTAGSSTSNPNITSGSQTLLQTNFSSTPSATLRLRAPSAGPSQTRRVVWAEDVIDNEGMGKKSSKVCCIYHKPHEPGDSDEESSGSSGSEVDSEPDLSRAQKAGGRGRKHNHGEGVGDRCEKGKGKERKPSPNAYERQPKYKGKKEG
ncbi:hypothetical protein DOTSEDRAFT_67281 [Dothistroma septosporum NZE10]|uniref:Type 1 phosphatases regulator n=1 Tax=Dothistroma septosporum (strain NZE10 / CBS 128990) TaxID=675120 RepID=N1PBP9_DOTSN|nr:hypothetical protein DOTSEDRAFT_67281 [Dothistroma septosporum NZE10]